MQDFLICTKKGAHFLGMRMVLFFFDLAESASKSFAVFCCSNVQVWEKKKQNSELIRRADLSAALEIKGTVRFSMLLAHLREPSPISALRVKRTTSLPLRPGKASQVLLEIQFNSLRTAVLALNLWKQKVCCANLVWWNLKLSLSRECLLSWVMSMPTLQRGHDIKTLCCFRSGLHAPFPFSPQRQQALFFRNAKWIFDDLFDEAALAHQKCSWVASHLTQQANNWQPQVLF